jgi:hypothetical protein
VQCLVRKNDSCSSMKDNFVVHKNQHILRVTKTFGSAFLEFYAVGYI